MASIKRILIKSFFIFLSIALLSIFVLVWSIVGTKNFINSLGKLTYDLLLGSSQFIALWLSLKFLNQKFIVAAYLIPFTAYALLVVPSFSLSGPGLLALYLAIIFYTFFMIMNYICLLISTSQQKNGKKLINSRTSFPS